MKRSMTGPASLREADSMRSHVRVNDMQPVMRAVPLMRCASDPALAQSPSAQRA
ncbi:hypothetical protein D3C72_2595380 [compost metagenome]